MKGLIIKDPWIDLILDGLKPWEIRGSNTSHRGHTELIKSTTGLRYGKGDLIGTKQLSPLDMHYYFDKHHVTDEVSYPKIWAWIFENVLWHPEPIPYKHPQGAVIWVNL
jgi:hypothetical protein